MLTVVVPRDESPTSSSAPWRGPPRANDPDPGRADHRDEADPGRVEHFDLGCADHPVSTFDVQRLSSETPSSHFVPVIAPATAYRSPHKLCAGGFGVVYARDKDTVAKMPLPKQNTAPPYSVCIRSGSDLCWVYARQDQYNEMMMYEHPHPHIARLIGCELDDVRHSVSALVYERGCGDLCDFIRQKGAIQKLCVFWKYVSQLLTVVRFLHERHIQHRDIKPDNILLFPGATQLKLTDFGSARFDHGSQPPTDGAHFGTLAYRPDVDILTAPGFADRVDEWALGCTFFCMAYGVPVLDSDRLQRTGYAQDRRYQRLKKHIHQSTLDDSESNARRGASGFYQILTDDSTVRHPVEDYLGLLLSTTPISAQDLLIPIDTVTGKKRSAAQLDIPPAAKLDTAHPREA